MNHLDAPDRARITRVLQATVGMLPDIERLHTGWSVSDDEFLECRLGRSVGTEKHDIHLMVGDARTQLRHEVLVDGSLIQTTVVEEVEGAPRAGSVRIENASRRIRGWLSDVGQVDDENLVEVHRSAERMVSAALLAAACRHDNGWSHAFATMGWLTSEACIMLDYDDGRCLTRFCASGEEPCDGTLSLELQRALQSTASVRHLIAKRSIFDPGPTFTFGPPPIICVRSVDISALRRLEGIADAIDQGFEIIQIEPDPTGGD